MEKLFTKESEEEGKAGSLSQTGRLGEVMKESVEIVKIAVYNFLTENPHLCQSQFKKSNFHLHVPQGAIPKDGPSAGTSLFVALISVILKQPVIANMALTGEISTLGEVICIGGVREKLTACKNHNITKVILPLSNQKDVKKLPQEFKDGFTIFFVKDIQQVFKICFESPQLEESNFN